MYSSAQDVRSALAPGAASGTAASLDDAQILDAIAQADARINGYLPQGYTVPTQQVQQGDPPAPVDVATNVIRFWSRDIAAYLATLTFKRNQDVSENDPVRLRYDAAMSDLGLVAAGKFVLPTDADLTDGSDEVFVFNQYDQPLFGTDLGYGGNPRNYELHTRGIW